MRVSSHSGFSLLEVMAVLAILGVAIASVTLTIGRGGAENRLQDQIEQFLAVAEFSADRAVLTGEPMGLLFEPPQWQTDDPGDARHLGWRYQWKTGSPTGWQDVLDFKPFSFDPETQFVISMDDIEWDWEELLDRTQPVTAYYPTGDISDITITITDSRLPGYEQTLHLNEYGELEWKEMAEKLKAREKP
jgi:general secretion pathway protein H